MQFGKKQPITRYLYTKFGIALLLIIIFFLSRSVYERLLIERKMAARTAEIQAELVALEERQVALKKQVEYLAGERGIEEEIRSNFDVAKEGEQVVILVGKNDEPQVLQIENSAPEKSKWWQFWR